MTPGHRKENRGLWSHPLLQAAAIAAGTLLFHGLYFNQGIRNLVDLGVAAVDGERILQGQWFGRDFLAPYGPGRYYLAAAAFRGFGPSMAVLLSLFLVLRVCTDLAFWFAARKLLSPLYALLALLCIAAAHGPAHKVFLGLGLAVVLLAAFRWMEAPGPGRAGVLGLAAGGTGLFRYDLGAAAFLLGAALLALRRRPGRAGEGPAPLRGRWIPFLGGCFLAAAPGAGLVLASGQAPFLLRAELARASLLAGARPPGPGLFSPELWISRPATAALSLLLLAAPLLAAGLLAASSIRDRGEEKPGASPLPARGPGLAAAALGLLFFSQYLMEPKINRLLQVGPPLFLCLFLLPERLSRGEGKARRVLRFIAPLLLAGITGTYVLSDAGRGSIDSPTVLLHPQAKVEGARAGFACNPALASNLEWTLAWIRRNVPRGTFYASPSLPLLYFLAGKRNPAPVTDFSYLLSNREVQHRVLRALAADEVRCWISRAEAIQGFVPEAEAPAFHARLRILFPRETTLPNGFRVRWKP